MPADWSTLPEAKVLLCTPCYGGLINHSYMESVIGLLNASAASNVRIGVCLLPGDSLVTRARNTCVAKFLSEEHWTHIFFVDGDIGFDADQVHRLLAADRDIVCGAYPFKQYYWNNTQWMRPGITQREHQLLLMNYVFNPIFDKADEVVPTDGYAKVLDAATGFMMIKRGVFDKLREAYPHMQYRTDMPNHREGPLADHFWLFFDTAIDDTDPAGKRYLSEDYAFCRRWQQLQGEIWVDVHSALTHIGPHYFEGHLSGTMMQREISMRAAGSNLAGVSGAELLA